MLVRSSGALALMTCLAFASASRAEQPSKAQASAVPQSDSGTADRDANALFEEGRKLMTAGLFDQACPKFEEAAKAKEGVGILLNLADCYDRIGRTASAWTTYSQAAKLAGDKKDSRADFAQQRASALEPRLLKVTIEVPSSSAVAGLRVYRDGVLIEEPFYGDAVPVDPGAYVIEAKAPGRLPWSRRVAIQNASAVVTVPPLDVDPKAAPVTAPPTADTTSHGMGTQKTLALVLGGAGVVGLGVGAVFGIISSSKHGTAEDHCSSEGGQYLCDAEGVDAANSARSAGNVSTIAFIAGGVLLGAGAALWFTAPSATDSVRVGVAPNGVRVRGTF